MESQLNQVTKKFTIIEVTCYDWRSLKVLSQFLASQSNPCQQLGKKNKKRSLRQIISFQLTQNQQNHYIEEYAE